MDIHSRFTECVGKDEGESMSEPKEVTRFYLAELEKVVGGKIVGTAWAPDDSEFPIGEFFGLRIKLSPNNEKVMWILRDDEGNGPGSFEIAAFDPD